MKGEARKDVDEDKTVGFTRKEMHKKGPAGSAKMPETHVFIVLGDRKSWPAKLEKADGPIRTLTRVLTEHPSVADFQLAFKITAVEATPGVDQDGDAYIFPDNVHVTGIRFERLSHFAKACLLEKDFSGYTTSRLTGSKIFVCAHGSRDRRCGYCGPRLIEAFRAAVEGEHSGHPISIHACSHVGGHAFAGNAILYREGKFVDWLGYLRPEDAEYVVKLCRDPTIPVDIKFWRGRMGISREAHKVVVQDMEDFLHDGAVVEKDSADGSCACVADVKVSGDIAGSVSQLDDMMDNIAVSGKGGGEPVAKRVGGSGSQGIGVNGSDVKILESKQSSTIPQVIFVLGGPGSGKGTQCEMIAHTFPCLHISAGEVLREESADPCSKLGSTISSYIEEGKIVPIDITVPLLLRKMEQSYYQTFIIDGFPRSLDNWNGWERLVGNRSSVLGVMYFDCPEEVLRARLYSRGRSDDKKATIQKRLDTFRSQTLPIIRTFENKGLLWRINGDQPEEAVFNDVQQYLERKLKPTKNGAKRSRPVAKVASRLQPYSFIALGAAGAVVVAGLVMTAWRRRSDTRWS